jgi:hypothetical protein
VLQCSATIRGYSPGTDHVRDLEDANATASLVLWNTIRSHKVMEDYSRRNFYEHPSISAPDSTLEYPVRKLEEALAQHTRKFDSLESRIARLEQKNDITPRRGGEPRRTGV